jgi:predicted metal-dependent phosphoesterase TrpH
MRHGTADRKGMDHHRDDLRTVRFDMHVHSRYSSDSITPIRSIVESWERFGVLPLVCDHNTITGSVKVYREICVKDPSVPMILAEEILTSDGEIIGAFLNEEIPPYLSAEETLDSIRDQGAVAIVPHPFCSFRSSVIRAAVLDRIVHRVDIIEGFNGMAVCERDNYTARRYAVLHNKPVSAGSDAHTPEQLGLTYVALQAFSSPAELIRALRTAEIHFRRAFPTTHPLNRYFPGTENPPGMAS